MIILPVQFMTLFGWASKHSPIGHVTQNRLNVSKEIKIKNRHCEKGEVNV